MAVGMVAALQCASASARRGAAGLGIQNVALFVDPQYPTFGKKMPGIMYDMASFISDPRRLSLCLHFWTSFPRCLFALADYNGIPIIAVQSGGVAGRRYYRTSFLCVFAPEHRWKAL